MKSKLHYSLSLLLIILFGSTLGYAQSTCTNHAITGNANNSVLFNVANTNSNGIIVTSIDAMINGGFAGTYTFTLLYNPTEINSTGSTWTQGTVGAGQNGWVQAGSATVTLPAHTGPLTVLSGMSITIPTNDTFGFALTCSSTLNYSALTTTGVNVFTTGGVSILTGDNISWGAPALPTTPANYPRGFIGCIGWMSAVPCSGTPTAGAAAANPTSVCPTATSTLTVTGATAAVGLTYQWESSPAGQNNWSSISGATNSTYTTTTLSANTDYRRITTCSGNSASSTPVTVSLSNFYSCYCASAATNTGDEEIDSVTINGVSNTGGCTTAAPGPGSLLNRYSNFTTLGALTSVMQGSTVSFDIKQDECDGAPYYNNGVGIWIDYNHNGVFTDPGEAVFIESSQNQGPRHVVGNINIPITALTGTTGMRVIASEGNSGSTLTPCLSYGYGETEDYLIDITAAPSCSGNPSGGTVTGPATACPNASFTLVDNGYTVAAGQTYQWESSPAGNNTWTAITGATNTSYTNTAGITTATDYRLVVTCTNGGGTGTSTTATVGISPFYLCYCGPATGITLSQFPNNYLQNVTIVNGTLNNTTTTNMGPGGYTLFWPTTPTTTDALYQGQQYTINLTHQYTYYFTTAWIDFNGDGVFQSSESISITTANGGGSTSATATFTVPLTATPGLTGLRLRTYWTNLSAGQACAVNNSYETEDYVITILATPPCSGTPVAGTAVGPTSICANSNFNLGVTGYTVGTGITLQWESSPAGAGVWSPITGATDPSYTVTGGIATATDYHVVITCANGGGTDVSNTLAVGINPFYLCYCGPNTGISLSSFYDNYIKNVAVANGQLNNTTTAAGNGGYSLFWPVTTTTTDTFYQGQQYTLNVTHPYTYYYSTAWLDMNGDGVFSSSESIPLTTGSGGNDTLATGTFTVPFSAVPGLTGLRIRTYWTNLSAGQACATNSSYETEDYVVTIAVPPPCSGTPTAGTASGPSAVCAGANFNLSLSGYSLNSGISMQWESSPAGAGVWTPVSGATNPTFTVNGGITTATDYHVVVTCANGGATDVSNTLAITVSPFYLCYCGPNTGISLSSFFDNYITNVNITGGTLNSSTSAAGPGGYTLFWPTTATTTDNLSQGQQYTLNITHPYTYYYSTAWLDMNGDGVFSSTESITLTTANGGNSTSATGTFIVPFSATAGLTGLRVRTYWTTLSGSQACASNNSYETEDYVVTIVVPPACSGTPTAGTASGPSSVCSGVNFNLGLTGYSVASAISIQWESSPAGLGTWTAVSGATNPSYTVTGGITTATDYRAVVTCANGGGTDISNVVAIAINPFLACYCASMASNTGDEEIINVTVGSMNNSSTCTSTGGAGSMQNQYSTYVTTVTPAIVSQGQTVSFSIGVGTCGGNYGSGTAIFIDYNQNGSFADPGEQVYTTPSTTNGPHTVSGTFLVPMTALVGNTGMRVINAEGYSGTGITPCLGYGYGETEDYVINIAQATVCTGTPTAGTVTGPANACANTAFTMTVNGYTVGTGITLQWESSPAGLNTWTAVSGATNPTYIVSNQTAATDYHVVVTCNGTSNATTNTLAVAQNLPTQCYCIPTYTNGGTGDNIVNVVLGTLTNATTGNATPYYHDYTSLQPGTLSIPDLTQSLSHNLTLTFGTDGSQYSMVWIDFNQDGVFSTSESFTNGTNAGSGGSTTIAITVPATATLGQTRMRIRGGDDSQPTNTQACGATNSSWGEAEDYMVNIISATSCPTPTGLTVTNVGSGTADISWTAASGAAGYEYAITTSSTLPSSGTTASGTSVTGATFTAGSQAYWLHVRTNCGSGFSNWATLPFLANDNASGAILLTVGGGCTGNPYSNAIATQSTGEVYSSCNNQGTGVKTVWFKFVAPASGAVRVSTDANPQGTLTDSKVGLFSATNASNYTTFNIISCDDDGGVVGSGFNSILYATGLTSGTTYYVQVDVFDATTSGGTFCVTVDELSSAMIASGSLSCAAAQTPQALNATYTGWTPLLTSTGQLIALVRNTTGAAGSNFSANLTINSGAVRQAGNQYYLDRNYKINNSTISTPTDVQLFFLNSELTTLQGVDPAATMANLNVTKQTGSICQANYAVANGTNSALIQSGNGTVGGASWIQVSTSSFSNFYLMSGANPLAIKLRDISATNVGSRNRVDWNTESELKSDKFEVERSVDGKNFTYLATINAKGEASAYSYWDEKPVTGVNYYRLKMTDASGKSAYSEIVHATVKEGAFTIEAYPNPVSDVLTVKAYGTSSANATVTIMDATGKVVKIVTVVNGMAQVNMSGLAQGIYQVKYADNSHIQTIKVNKQ